MREHVRDEPAPNIRIQVTYCENKKCNKVCVKVVPIIVILLNIIGIVTLMRTFAMVTATAPNKYKTLTPIDFKMSEKITNITMSEANI